MRRVEFRTFLRGVSGRGHRIYISAESLSDDAAELLLRVDLNGHVFEAEGWPARPGEHLIEVPAEVADAVGLHPGDAARVAIDRMGA